MMNTGGIRNLPGFMTPKNPDYLSIGHPSFDPSGEECTHFLWIYTNKLLYEQANTNSIHSDVWPEYNPTLFFCGRYDGCKNTISIMSPMSKQGDPPSSLIRQLTRTFSDTAPIYLFGWNSGVLGQRYASKRIR